MIDIENMLKLALGDRGAKAWTINGAQVPASEWQKLVDARAEVFAWVLSADGLEMNLGRGARNATEVQRFAMAIRDGTCTSQDCDRRPAACDAHHLIPWTQGHGPTDIALMVLQCPIDHTTIHKMGVNLEPGDRPGEWKLVQKHTGKVVRTWTVHTRGTVQAEPHSRSRRRSGRRTYGSWSSFTMKMSSSKLRSVQPQRLAAHGNGRCIDDV